MNTLEAPGSNLQFRIDRVAYPGRCELLMRLHGGRVMEGRIVGTCDGVERVGQFAVVLLEGVDEPVIVELEPATRG